MLLTLLVQGLCGALSGARSAHAAHSNVSTCTANVDVGIEPLCHSKQEGHAAPLLQVLRNDGLRAGPASRLRDLEGQTRGRQLRWAPLQQCGRETKESVYLRGPCLETARVFRL